MNRIGEDNKIFLSVFSKMLRKYTQYSDSEAKFLCLNVFWLLVRRLVNCFTVTFK